MTNQNDHKTRVLFKQTLILTRQYLLTTPYFESHISIPSFTMVSARRWFLLLVIQTLKCSLFIKKSFLQSFHDVLLSVIKFSTKTFYNALARGSLLKWLWDIYCCLWHPGKKNIFHFTRYNSLIQTKKFSLFNYNNFLHSVQDVPISPNSFFYYEYFCFYHLSPCSITASMKKIISSVLLKQFSN